MRLSCLAILMLMFGLVGFDTFGTGSAPGQTPAPQPPATTPVPAPSAWAPAIGYGANPMADYSPLHPSNQFYRSGAMTHASAKEQELERQSRSLAQQYGKTESRDERDKLREKLNDALRQQFDAQQQRRRDEIKQIEEQLKKLQELMRKREDSKSTIVQRRLEQLLQEADGLGWTGSDPLPSFTPHALYPGQHAPDAASKTPNPIRR